MRPTPPPVAKPAAWPGPASPTATTRVDPASGVAGVLATQILPFADQAVLDLLTAFETAVYANR